MCTVGFLATAEMTNPAGVVQSGFLGAMAEGAIGPLTASLLASGQQQRTVELGVRPLAPVRPGTTITAHAVVTERGPSSALLEARLLDDSGREVATAWARKALD